MPAPHSALRRRILAGVPAIVLAACANFGPRVAPPTVTVNDVRLDRIEGAQAWFVAGVTLDNPNEREIAVESLDATLSIEGEAVATASLAAPVTLPAKGSAPAEIAARTGVDAILRAVASAMRRMGTGGGTPSPSLRYALEGSARLAGGLAVPFRRTGELGSRPAR
ncbi:MAG TPA: LEA type 2 family protein [Casimicrobiaceae bacterium]|nr:LEA type 2 family protein [Casimicrobiaceae bacterium]